MRTRPLLAAIVAVVALALAGCGGESARSPTAARPASLQAVPPEPVVQAVFDAARSGDTSKLGELCDPTERNDQDTQDICDLAKKKSGSAVDKFRQRFAKGAIRSTEVTGSKATIDFTYGPDGMKSGRMTLVQRDEQWYLSGL
ncbi:MAG: hypothetical protein H0W01_06705 [Pseudonocardiales bacterium]|nr:hypothetical protein [Pseudonocardiales bacterium]